MRYEDILTEVSKLDALSNAYLAERSISCLIVYSLPPATTSLFKYAPWDEPCLFVGDGITVDRTLAVRCRASLVREKRLDQMLAKQQLHHDDMRDCRGERRRSPRSGNRSSTRHSDNSRSRQDQTYSPVRSPSPPQVYSPPPLIPRRMRSRSRSHSPPRKRLRTTTDEDERSILLEAIKEVRRERDVAFEREDVLRHQLSMATEEKKALTLLERQVEAWTSTVETCEKRVHAYERRFCLLLDIERETAQTSGSSIVASGDVSSLGMLEGVIRDYKLRERRARRETAKVQASYNRRMDVLNGKGSSSGGQSFSNALSAVAQLAASIAS
ncbi:unnamed protein product [Peniophora sp. CBMAI 1063]|nr:unnamed protein product [Peniophora sp. CBMAI 1063]